MGHELIRAIWLFTINLDDGEVLGICGIRNAKQRFLPNSFKIFTQGYNLETIHLRDSLFEERFNCCLFLGQRIY